MPGAVAERFDFFLSRRGSVAATAQEVDDVLTAAGYKVFVQDYDIPIIPRPRRVSTTSPSC
jgi:hypothetical protein